MSGNHLAYKDADLLNKVYDRAFYDQPADFSDLQLSSTDRLKLREYVDHLDECDDCVMCVSNLHLQKDAALARIRTGLDKLE